VNIDINQLTTYLFSPRKVYEEDIFVLRKQRVFEIILLGWLCYAFFGFINISIVSFLSSGVLNSVFDGKFLIDLGLDFLVRYKIIIYLSSVFIFPLSRLILYYYLSFTLQVFRGTNDPSDFKPDPKDHVFYADIFYLVPFIGGTCRFFAALIYFYQSMRMGSRLNNFEILAIFLMPFAFLFCVGLSFIMGSILLFNLLGS
tara:strand:+ start:2262 stop:2861 length:600 start_codon:yes stop_codon:yes gene_type:complete